MCDTYRGQHTHNCTQREREVTIHALLHITPVTRIYLCTCTTQSHYTLLYPQPTHVTRIYIYIIHPHLPVSLPRSTSDEAGLLATGAGVQSVEGSVAVVTWVRGSMEVEEEQRIVSSRRRVRSLTHAMTGASNTEDTLSPVERYWHKNQKTKEAKREINT